MVLSLLGALWYQRADPTFLLLLEKTATVASLCCSFRGQNWWLVHFLPVELLDLLTFYFERRWDREWGSNGVSSSERSSLAEEVPAPHLAIVVYVEIFAGAAPQTCPLEQDIANLRGNQLQSRMPKFP